MGKTSSSGSGSSIAIIIVYNNKHMYKLLTFKYKLDFISNVTYRLRFMYFKLRAKLIIVLEILLMQRLCYDRTIQNTKV